MNSVFLAVSILGFLVVLVESSPLTIVATAVKNNETSQQQELGVSTNMTNETLSVAASRKKRQGYYNLGNTDYRPNEFNDGVSVNQLSNPLSPAHQVGQNVYGQPGTMNQVNSNWLGNQFSSDVGSQGANIVENVYHQQQHQPMFQPGVGGGGFGGQYPNEYTNGNYEHHHNYNDTVNGNGNGNGHGHGHGNGNGNGNGHYNGNGKGNGNGNGMGAYNPFSNVELNKPANTNYLQMNYGVQGNLYNPLIPSIYGYQYQQNQPFVSEQENQFGKPQNQFENQQQVINNPNIFGGYGEYNSPLTFQQIYGPYLNTAGYSPTTTTAKPRTTTEPPRYHYSKSFNPYEGMTTRRLPVTPQVLWFSRYVDLTAPIAAVPFSSYNNI